MHIFNLFDKSDKNKIRKGFLIGAILFLIVIALITFFQIRTQILEISEIGAQYTSIYWTDMMVKYLMMLGAFVVIYAVTYLTNKVISSNLLKFFAEENVEPIKLPNKSISFFVALVTSFFVKDFLARNVLVYLNSTSFQLNDPIFFKDIGYYMFQRPFLMDLCNFLKGLNLAVIVYSLGYYVLVFGACFNGILLSSLKKNNVVKHNLINVAVFFLISSLTYRFTMEESLLGTFSNGLIGSGYTDINIMMTAYKIAMWLVIAVVVIAYVFLERNKIKKAIITMAIVPVFWGFVYVSVWGTQFFVVTPNEFAKESEYIGYNLKSTKQAYNIDAEEVRFPVSAGLTENSLLNNAGTVENIQIADKEATLKALNQNQATRGYYTFNDVDVAQYDINGKSTTVYLGAREVDTEDMNYINRTFQYTHGLGVVMSPVNVVDKNGEPQFILNELKPEPSYGDIKITEPRIYFGETMDNYAIVNAIDINEIDYPEGDKSIETRYTGTAGIKLSFWNRLLMSIKNTDIQMLVSGYINSDSKLLMNRNIIDRVEKIAPFIRFDEDAYMVVNDEGKLFWIIDGYTLSTNYPYAEYFEIEGKTPGLTEKYNYIRNSVKAVVDAYNGDVTLYITDRRDPIIMAYNKAYPELFADLDTETIPADIQKHLRYPSLLFKIQAEKLEKYHVTDVSTFYKDEDAWTIATHNTGSVIENVKPYYTYIKIPNLNVTELVLMIPYTPQGRSSLTSWLAVRSNGEMLIYTFPKDSNVLGTIQLDNKIDQDTQTARDLNLGGGTRVTREVRVFPIDNSLLYVEPIYIEAVNEDAVPQLRKVAVSYNNTLAIADTLAEALQQLLSDATGTIRIDIDDEVSLSDTIDNTIDAYMQLKQASQNGSWEEFGKQMTKLDEYINKLNEQKEQLEATTENNVELQLSNLPISSVPVVIQ